MRKISNILMLAGVIIFVFMSAIGFVTDSLSNPLIEVVRLCATVSLVVGFVMRLFAPKPALNISVTPTESTATPTSTNPDYRFWSIADILGIFAWFLAMMASAMSYEHDGVRYLILTGLALPVVAISLVVASYKQKTNIDLAIRILKVPFYYGLVAFVILVGSALLGL